MSPFAQSSAQLLAGAGVDSVTRRPPAGNLSQFRDMRAVTGHFEPNLAGFVAICAPVPASDAAYGDPRPLGVVKHRLERGPLEYTAIWQVA